jgi:hypothetical protein
MVVKDLITCYSTRKWEISSADSVGNSDLAFHVYLRNSINLCDENGPFPWTYTLNTRIE